MSTRREAIEELLQNTDVPLTAKDICDSLDISAKSIVYEDIEHISKTVRAKGKELLVNPAVCIECGYRFPVGHNARRPSKCPKCRSERIEDPSFIIKRKT
jgi:hypothetical protein